MMILGESSVWSYRTVCSGYHEFEMYLVVICLEVILFLKKCIEILDLVNKKKQKKKVNRMVS